MNRVYLINTAVEGCAYLTPVDSRLYLEQLILHRKSTMHLGHLRVKLHTISENGESLILPDFLHLSSYHFCLTPGARDLLMELPGNEGTWIECVSDTGIVFWLFDPIIHAHTLDQGNSLIDYYSNSSKIRKIRKYSFSQSARDLTVFRMEEAPALGVFCNDNFKSYVEEKKLTGIQFSLCHTNLGD